MTMREQPVYQSAVARLARTIETVRASGSPRIPPSRLLARQMGVSLPTVLRALAHYRKQGVITACPGLGTHLVSQVPETAGAASPPTVKWQRVRQALASDVLAAMDAPDQTLPAMKELCARYGASRLTVRKAVRELLREGILAETAHGFQARPPAAPGHSSTIVLVALGDTERKLALTSGRTLDHVRWLESACSRAGVTLVTLPCAEAAVGLDVGRTWRRIAAATGDGTLVGVIVWAIAMRCDWRAFLAQRTRPLLPIALLDEVGDEPLTAAWHKSAQARLFTMANSALAGEDVGRWLLARGHRHAAFFSADHQATFSRNRLAGLVRAFGSLGLAENVHPQTENDLYHSPAMLSAQSECNRLVREAAARARGPSSRAGSLRHEIATSLATHGQTLANNDIEQWVMRRHFAASFQACYQDPRITAWVALTDSTALACKQFLDTRDRPIALVGFDNSADASTHALTSYDFNGAAVMRAMVSHVLAPRWQALRSAGHKPVELNGYIAVRGMAYNAGTTRTR
jgi:DNA-binding FadR family transcriptional regulator/DNA-binding LacI/PurR family transcriptional regulator